MEGVVITRARLWIAVLVLLQVAGLGYLLLRGAEEPLPPPKAEPVRNVEVARLDAGETARLGWDPGRLDAVFAYAATLSTDTLMIVTDGKGVASLGDTTRSYDVHGIRTTILGALIGQHVGPGERQVPFDATLVDIGIDDAPGSLTPLNRTATVLDLIRSVSGISHPAAAETPWMTSERDRRLGDRNNEPGKIWANNNWDYNALTTILETRVGKRIADMFAEGIAGPTGMTDYTVESVRYLDSPELSRHKAAMFWMSGRDLARFGQLYLDGGAVDGAQIVPAAWVDRITADSVLTFMQGLPKRQGYLWWIPDPEFGLPDGTFWAWGLGSQAVFVIPSWRTVVVHQSDTAEASRRGRDLMRTQGFSFKQAFDEIMTTCRAASKQTSEFCVEHRPGILAELEHLMTLIVQARL